MKKGVIFLIMIVIAIPISYSAEVGVKELFEIGRSERITQDLDSEGVKTFFYVEDKVVASKGDTVKYHHLDRRGSDTSGKQLPFGQELIDSGERFEFTGKELDSNSDLHYFNARYYDSEIGKFISVDPIKDNPAYLYVGNNPMNLVDPNGLEPQVIILYSSGTPGDAHFARIVASWINNDVEGWGAIVMNAMDYKTSEEYLEAISNTVENQPEEDPILASIIAAEGLQTLVQFPTQEENTRDTVKSIEVEQVEGENHPTSALGQALGTGIQQCLMAACYVGDERTEDNFAQTLSRDTRSRVTAPRGLYVHNPFGLMAGWNPLKYDEETGRFDFSGFTRFDVKNGNIIRSIFGGPGRDMEGSAFTFYINGVPELTGEEHPWENIRIE